MRLVRRISALVNHSQIGFRANALCVWQVPAGHEDEVGRAIAGFTAVTHCYRRPVSDDWPYAIFCTIHGRNRAACEETARQIAQTGWIRSPIASFSTSAN